MWLIATCSPYIFCANETEQLNRGESLDAERRKHVQFVVVHAKKIFFACNPYTNKPCAYYIEIDGEEEQAR